MIVRVVPWRDLLVLHRHHCQNLGLASQPSSSSSSRARRACWCCTNQLALFSCSLFSSPFQKDVASPFLSLETDASAGTHPSLPTGVALPLALNPPTAAPAAPPPSIISCASRSFCSMTSARRFRKSDRATRPTVWFWSRSSAVLVCVVNRGLGVVAPEPGLEGAIVNLVSVLSRSAELFVLRIVESAVDESRLAVVDT